MWRDFTEQPQAISILKRQVARQQIVHAYIFHGPIGVGKKKVALQLAKSIFCLHPHEGDSCEECINCRRIENGNHPDLHIIEPDGESIKISQIRNLRKEFTYFSVESKAKIYIIEAADTMTREAGNSLLKFLEEPGQGVTAILITSNLHSLLPTIKSRCQLISFKPLPWIKVASEVEEKFGISKGSARVAAQIAGNVDEVYQLCQRETFAQLRTIVLKFYKDLNKLKSLGIIQLQEHLFLDHQLKDEVPLFLDISLVWFRDLAQIALGNVDSVANVDYMEVLQKQAQESSLLQISKRIERIFQTRNRIKSMNPQLALEQLILHLEEAKAYV